jgi:hypothetical protein
MRVHGQRSLEHGDGVVLSPAIDSRGRRVLDLLSVVSNYPPTKVILPLPEPAPMVAEAVEEFPVLCCLEDRSVLFQTF